MTPKVLNDISQKISNSQIHLESTTSDGRVDSINWERKITEFIKENTTNVKIAQDRSWYDIKIENFYCNIKISEMTSNDNTIGKSVIHYFLTGLDQAPNQYEELFRSMKENESEDEKRDYYFIVIKKSSKEVFVISLKNLKVKPSPNNPPFQCDWSENINQKERSKRISFRAMGRIS